MQISRPRILAVSFLLVLLTATTALAQPDPFLSRFEGTWRGEGQAFGMASRMEITWEWVLIENFLRLTLENNMTRQNRTTVFQGRAYYKAIGGDKFEAQWFDSRGETFPIKAHRDGDSLVALWGSPDKEEGKSIYRLIDAATLEVIDSVKQKDGTWREFGRVTLKRT